MGNAIQTLRSRWARKFWWGFWLLYSAALIGLIVRCTISADLWVLFALIGMLFGGLLVGSWWTT